MKLESRRARRFLSEGESMGWQRRTMEIPSVKDLTSEEVGTAYVWDLRAIVECAACKRPGALSPKTKLPSGVKNVIAHAVDSEGALTDYCVEAEFVPGSPTHIVLDREGNPVNEFYPTTSKVGGRN